MHAASYRPRLSIASITIAVPRLKVVTESGGSGLTKPNAFMGNLSANRSLRRPIGAVITFAGKSAHVLKVILVEADGVLQSQHSSRLRAWSAGCSS